MAFDINLNRQLVIHNAVTYGAYSYDLSIDLGSPGFPAMPEQVTVLKVKQFAQACLRAMQTRTETQGIDNLERFKFSIQFGKPIRSTVEISSEPSAISTQGNVIDAASIELQNDDQNKLREQDITAQIKTVQDCLSAIFNAFKEESISSQPHVLAFTNPARQPLLQQQQLAQPLPKPLQKPMQASQSVPLQPQVTGSLPDIASDNYPQLCYEAWRLNEGKATIFVNISYAQLMKDTSWWNDKVQNRNDLTNLIKKLKEWKNDRYLNIATQAKSTQNDDNFDLLKKIKNSDPLQPARDETKNMGHELTTAELTEKHFRLWAQWMADTDRDLKRLQALLLKS